MRGDGDEENEEEEDGGGGGDDAKIENADGELLVRQRTLYGHRTVDGGH